MNGKVIGTIHTFKQPFRLESGAVLPRLDIAYETYGTLNKEGTNGILVCHALTGSAHAGSECSPSAGPGWWEGILGKGKGLDTDKYFVVCANIPGSCYGSTGPTSVNPDTGKAYRTSFPAISVRDMVRAEHLLLRALGVNELATVIGGSLGGMQVLEWAVMFPGTVRSIIPIATAAQHSPWCIGLDDAQRLAIMNDPAWKNGLYEEQPREGIALARMLAMISYRSKLSFDQRFGRDPIPPEGPSKPLHVARGVPLAFQIESYLRYQGEKLAERFDANSYLCLTRAMDSHDVGAGRGSVADALGSIKAHALCIGVSSDVLYPRGEQRKIASMIPGAHYAEIKSEDGHDAFLIEFDQINRLIRLLLT